MCIISHEEITATCEDSKCIINRIKGEKQALQNQLDWLGGGLKSWADRFTRISSELQKFADAGDLDVDNNVLHQFLADEFDLVFVEKHSIELTIRITAYVEMPGNYELGTNDFYFEDGTLKSNTDDVELVNYLDPYISDLDITA